MTSTQEATTARNLKRERGEGNGLRELRCDIKNLAFSDKSLAKSGSSIWSAWKGVKK